MGKWLYKRIRYIFSSLLEIIYLSENECFICEKETDQGTSICSHCEKYLPYLDNNYLEYKDVSLKKVYSIFSFEGKIKEIIYDVKYNKKAYLANIIGDIMAEFIEKNKIKVDIIIPIPMHEKKIQEREYNHAYLIAKRIGAVLGIKVSDSLKKIKYTQSQVLLNGSERWYNVKGSFESMVLYHEKNILLIDDVVTTCATGHFSAIELGESNNVSLLSLASSKKF